MHSQSVDTVWLLNFSFGDRLLRGKTKPREGGYTEEHEQPSLDSEQSGQVRARGGDASTSTRAVGDGTAERASIHTDEHE